MLKNFYFFFPLKHKLLPLIEVIIKYNVALTAITNNKIKKCWALSIGCMSYQKNKYK